MRVLLRALEFSISPSAVVHTGIPGVRVMRLVALMATGVALQESPIWLRWISASSPYRRMPRSSPYGTWLWTNGNWSLVKGLRAGLALPASAFDSSRRRPQYANAGHRRTSRSVVFGLAVALVSAVVFEADRWIPPVAPHKGGSTVTHPGIDPDHWAPTSQAGVLTLGEPNASHTQAAEAAQLSASQSESATAAEQVGSSTHKESRSLHRVSEKKRPAPHISKTHGIAQARSQVHRAELRDDDLPEAADSTSSELAALRQVQASREQQNPVIYNDWMQHITQRRLTEIPDRFAGSGQ